MPPFLILSIPGKLKWIKSGLANKGGELEFMAGTRRGGREGGWALLCHLMPCHEVIPCGCPLNLPYMWPLPKHRGPTFSPVLSSAVHPHHFLSARSSVGICWGWSQLDLAENRAAAALVFSSVPSPLLAQGRWCRHTLRAGPSLWQQQALRSTYSSSGNTPSKSRSE